MLPEYLDAMLDSYHFRLGQSGNERHEAGNYATYRQTLTRRPQVLFIGEWTRHRYHRAPVFFLLLTGAAEENFAITPPLWRGTETNTASPAKPLVNQAAPWLWSRPAAERAAETLPGRSRHAR